MKKLLLVVFATAVLAAAPAAKASSIPYGTFGYTGLGTPSYTGANLGSATSVTVPTGIFVNNVPTMYLGQPNIFYPATEFQVYLSAVYPTALTVSNINTGSVTYNLNDYLTWAFSGDTYYFSLGSGSWTSSGIGNLSFQGLGTFSDSLGDYIGGPAEISLGFTQNGTVNYSGTFEVPPPPPAPEPSSLVLLGTGLLGAALLVIWRSRSARRGLSV
jgi:hypothetical protein